MACIAPDLFDARMPGIGYGPLRTPVIADRGDRADVVILHSVAPLRVGERFELDGLTWEIARSRSLQRGFVARPLRLRRAPSEG